MRRNITAMLMTCVFAMCASSVFALEAAVAERIMLPQPVKTGGMPLHDALTARRTSRDFADRKITEQELSDLLWAAAGVNRPESGKTTYPVARGRKDMIVFAFMPDGAYRYDPDAHALVPVPGVQGDRRADTGTQGFVAKAAVNLVYVHDMNFWNASEEERRHGEGLGGIHTGAIMQNVYLHAAQKGWSAVARGMFNENKLRELLDLEPLQRVLLTQSVGPAR